MRSIEKEQVFIKLESKYVTTVNSFISLKDIGEIYCKDKDTLNFMENLRAYDAGSNKGKDYISAVDVIRKVNEKKDNIDVVMVGEPEVLIEIKDYKKPNNVYTILKVIFICVLLFLGSGLAIVYFHEDVNMKDAMERLYYIVTGTHKKNPLILTIPYSLGIGIGMGAFFGRIYDKNITEKPGPLEVENYLYNKDSDDFVVESIKNNKQK